MKSLRRRSIAKLNGFLFKKSNNIHVGECWLFYYSSGMICSKPLPDKVFLDIIENPKLWNEEFYNNYLHYTIKYILD